jgi:hypothetical protein
MLWSKIATFLIYITYVSYAFTTNNIGLGCSERTIYKNYLLGLRKTRKLLSNANNTLQINFITDYTQILPHQYINNSETTVKNIIMGNIIVDVSTVKYIYIKTSNDSITLELDKSQIKDNNIINNINNVETLINTLSILAKILNVN